MSAKAQRDAGKDHPESEKQIEQWTEVASMAEDITSEPERVMRGAQDLVKGDVLVDEVEALMLIGLISREDFGWAGNPLITKAERQIEKGQFKVRPMCLRLPKSGSRVSRRPNSSQKGAPGGPGLATGLGSETKARLSPPRTPLEGPRRRLTASTAAKAPL